MCWDSTLDALEFMLVKCEPVARHGDQFHGMLGVSLKMLGGGQLCKNILGCHSEVRIQTTVFELPISRRPQHDCVQWIT